MLKSMTGFGSFTAETDNYALSVEIKTLNSKFLDPHLRYPSLLSSKEGEIRGLLGRLQRGKVSVNINFTDKRRAVESVNLNSELLAAYVGSMRAAARDLELNEDAILRSALQMPDVFSSKSAVLDDDIWAFVRGGIEKAIEDCDNFRKTEGESLYKMLHDCIAEISDGMDKIEVLEPGRLARIRERIRRQIDEFVQNDHFDANRFEQELIFYAEKLDINEERVRLRTHLPYFLEVTEKTDTGKKLNFIAQEIGREINTIGSKANDADIQHLVVEMKESLEKIKEQINNVL